MRWLSVTNIGSIWPKLRTLLTVKTQGQNWYLIRNFHDQSGLLARIFRREYRKNCVASQTSSDCSCSGAVRRQHSNGFGVRSILCKRWQQRLRSSSSSNGGHAFFTSSSHVRSTTSGRLCGMPQDRRAVLAATPGLRKLCSGSSSTGKFTSFFR
jgi:hypothetical protein